MTGPVSFGADALGRLMPMFVKTSMNGEIESVGPTLARVLGDEVAIGHDLFEVFAVKHRQQTGPQPKFENMVGQMLRIRLNHPPHTEFKAMLVPSDDDGYLMNLSFGIGVIQAVGDFDLTAADFPATDLTIEMLYLNEAKSAVLQESHNLVKRLQGAKVAAEEKAYTDTLTGLKNRRAMDFTMNRFIKGSDDFGLMHIDLDYFKAVNDTKGHAAGDYVLQHVSRILVSETRGEDTVARVGGDEFVVLLKNMTDIPTLKIIGERIISALERPIMFDGDELQISASVGATVSTNYHSVDPDIMMHHADLALYASKDAGRAAFTPFAPEMDTKRSA